MKPKLALAALFALLAFAFPAQSSAQAPGISLMIQKHASLTQQGAAVIRIRIVCGPFEGVEEFQEGHAGGTQARTGATSESGIDGTVICDGVERTHTAHLSPFDGAFKPGPARATASLFLCMLVEDEQMCFSGSASRRVIIQRPKRDS
jgi:hypothetical protein